MESGQNKYHLVTYERSTEHGHSDGDVFGNGRKNLRVIRSLIYAIKFNVDIARNTTISSGVLPN